MAKKIIGTLLKPFAISIALLIISVICLCIAFLGAVALACGATLFIVMLPIAIFQKVRYPIHHKYGQG